MLAVSARLGALASENVIPAVMSPRLEVILRFVADADGMSPVLAATARLIVGTVGLPLDTELCELAGALWLVVATVVGSSDVELCEDWLSLFTRAAPLPGGECIVTLTSPEARLSGLVGCCWRMYLSVCSSLK